MASAAARPDPKKKSYPWASSLQMPSLEHFNKSLQEDIGMTPAKFREGIEEYRLRNQTLVYSEEGELEGSTWTTPPTLGGLRVSMGFTSNMQLHRYLKKHPTSMAMYQYFKSEVEAFSEGCLYMLTNSSGAQMWLRCHTDEYAKDQDRNAETQQDSVKAVFVSVEATHPDSKSLLGHDPQSAREGNDNE